MFRLLAIASGLGLPLCVSAHGDPSEHIAEIGEQLAHDPDNVPLLLKRGELHRLAGNHEAALTDFERAAEFQDSSGEVGYQLGLTLLQMNRAAAAKSHLDRYVVANPNDVKARAVQARTLAALGESGAAADEFTRVIVTAPLPEYYLERASALHAAGETAAALDGLNQGLVRLGDVVSLQRMALTLELKQRNPDDALVRIDKLAAITGRADIWLARRGDVLLDSGCRQEAIAAYTEALSAISRLPSRRQRSKQVQESKVRLQEALRDATSGPGNSDSCRVATAHAHNKNSRTDKTLSK